MQNFNFFLFSFNGICLAKTRVIRYLFASMFVLFFLPLEAQVLIKTKSTPDIAVCQSAEKLEVEIIANATFTQALDVTVQLPLGISYIPESLEVLNAPANVELKEKDVSDVTQAIFEINASAATPFNEGERMVFTIEREADCMAIVYAQSGGTFEDLIMVDFAGGSEDELGAPYNVLFASLALFGPNQVSAEAGTIVEREMTIVNGGLACTDSIRYELEFSPTKVAIEEILLEGVSLPFEVVNNRAVVSIYTDFFLLIGNGNACFDDGETLVLKEKIRLEGCNTNTAVFKHRVNWGCKEEECNQSEEVQSSIKLNPSTPVNLFYQNMTSSQPSSCTNGFYEVMITNVGNQIAYSFNIQLGWGPSIVQNQAGIVVNAQVNDSAYPVLNSGGYLLDFTTNTSESLGLSDVNDDGFFDALLPEQSLRIRVEIDYDCVSVSDKSIGRLDFYVKSYYKDACDVINSKVFKTNYYMERSLKDQYINGDTDIWNDGNDYTFSFCTEGTQKMNCLDDKAELEMNLPSYLIPIRAYLNDGTPLTIEAGTGGKAVVTGIEGVAIHCIHVDFQLECVCFETPKLLSFEWAYAYICEEECDCREVFFEDTYDVYTHCRYASIAECADGNAIIIDIGEGGGDFEGCLMTLNMEAERASFGWTDFTFTEHVEATDEDIQLDLALPCDSIRVKADGIAISNVADNVFIRVIYNSPTSQESLEYTSGKVHYYDTQTGNTYDCPVSANASIASNIEENQWAIDINLTETLGNCYPKTKFSALDSINFEGYFLVLDSGLSPNSLLHHYDLSNFRTFHYWVNDEGTELNCDHVGDRMFLNNYEMELKETFPGLSSCWDGGANLGFMFIGRRFDDLFPNEIRPFMFVDSIEVLLPSGFTYIQGSAVFGSLPLSEISIQDPKTEVLSNGQIRLLFVSDETWPIGDKVNNGEFAGELYFNYYSPCRDNQLFEYTFFYQSPYYSDNSSCIEPKSQTQKIDLFLQRSYVTISTMFYENEGFARNNTISVQLCKSYSSEIVLPYLLLQTKGSNLSVLEVSANNVEVDFQEVILEDGNLMITFEGVDWNNLLCVDLEIKTSYMDCFNSSYLTFKPSYTCDEYPQKFNDITCSNDTRLASIEPNPAEVQLQVNGPIEAIPLCDPFTYEFIVNSAQLANIYEPILNIEFPPLGGLALASNPTIEYPLGTTPREFTPEITATGLRFDLAAADLESTPSANIEENGIEGLGIGTANTRKAIVRLPLITDCNFISGSSIRATITANRPCGSPATGSGITQLLEPILIEGAIPSYITLTTIDSDAVSYCEANSTVKVQIINEGPAPTSADEHCYIFMPQNVLYLNGSTQNLTEHTVGEPLQNLQSPFTQLDFTMPENVAANDTIVFTFNVDASNLAECENAFVEFIAQTIEFVPLLCVSENANCNLPVKTSEGTGYFDITIGGPEMNLSATARTGCAPEEDGELTIKVNLANVGNKAVLTQNVVVDIYSDLNGNGTVDSADVLLDSLVYTNFIEAGESITLEGSWTLDPTLAEALIFVLEADYYCSGCEDVTFYIPQVPPISALHLEQTIDCDEDTELYTAYFDIFDGVPPYNITGSASAVINNNNFHIPNVPYGFPLIFYIEDGVGCKDTVTVNDLCGEILPVELLYFGGKAMEEGNLLQWETASELNNDYFTLKRSIDGKNFDLLAVVEGFGTTSVLQKYGFLDRNAPNGTVYYQLSQTDLDGKVKKLKAISLNRESRLTKLQIISIQPIPAKDFFTLQCFSPNTQNLDIQVFNANYQSIYRQQLAAQSGTNEWRLDCSSWTSGVYILQIRSEEETVVAKIVRQ